MSMVQPFQPTNSLVLLSNTLNGGSRTSASRELLSENQEMSKGGPAPIFVRTKPPLVLCY
ncbi:MAG: hypothetical protein HGA37_02870 [Lentimicrobium sp.]|nr:hypothetical protein [Lentimicrobium sp.]